MTAKYDLHGQNFLKNTRNFQPTLNQNDPRLVIGTFFFKLKINY
jgi:hypothetical protein